MDDSGDADEGARALSAWISTCGRDAMRGSVERWPGGQQCPSHARSGRARMRVTGVRGREITRKVWRHFTSGYPWRLLWVLLPVRSRASGA